MGKDWGRISIDVTERDIERAVEKNSMRCVVAQAIARTIPDATRIDVDVQSIRWTQDGERQVYLTPYAVQGYVIAFDAGETIEPFMFKLDTRKRMPTKRRVKTDAGREKDQAGKKVRDQKRKVEQLELTAKGATLPPPSPTEKKVAKTLLPVEREELAAREENLAAVVERTADIPKQVSQGEGRKPPPKVYRTSERHYGMRKLRVNWPENVHMFEEGSTSI